MTTYVLPLPFTTPPLSLNDRMHWAREAKLKKEIRDAAHVTAASKRMPRNVQRVAVTLTYYPSIRRNRDEDNLSATLKPAIDGLVSYGLVPDDNSAHVTSGCRIGEIRKPSALTLTVEVLA